MAHLLENENDMAYFGETPWHRLGVKLERLMSVEEALQFAALDFKVKKVPLHLPSGEVAPGGFATIREDNNRVLGIVGKGYEVVQNAQALDFFNSFISQKEAIFNTVGSISGGSKVWFLAQLPGEIVVKGDDVIHKYLLLATSHDGTITVVIKFTPTRVVCANTFQVALNNNTGLAHKIRHTKFAHGRILEASKVMGLANRYYEDLGEACRVLQAKAMSATETHTYIEKVFASEAESALKGSTRASNIMDTIYGLVETGKGTDLPGVRGTAWGAYNAVTEYLDHHKRYHSDDTALESINFSSVIGSIKQNAWNLALAH